MADDDPVVTEWWRKISLGTVVAIVGGTISALVYLAGIIWWISSLNSQVIVLTQHDVQRHTQMTIVTKALQDGAVLQGRMDERLEFLVDAYKRSHSK